MASYSEEWADWNPMAQDFNNDYSTEDGQMTEEALIPDAQNSVSINDPIEAERLARNAKRLKYPYLVVKKTTSLVTETMLKNFFGRDLIQDQEYRKNSQVFFVYFKNIGCFEAALMKVGRFPNLIEWCRGNPRALPESAYAREDNIAVKAADPDPGPTPSITERTEMNLSLRTIAISIGDQKHPVFIKPPLLTKADYSAKESLLAISDPDQRYLNVKYEFALERHGVYVVKEDRLEINCTMHYLSGRTRAMVIVDETKSTEDNDTVTLSDLIDKMKLRKCVSCQLWTFVFCKLCKTPFCNEKCFEDVAKEHAESCGTGKELELGDGFRRGPKFPEPKMPPSKTVVKITAFQQTNICYVRSMALKDNIAYNGVINEVMTEGKEAARLENLPKCGQMVLFKFQVEIVRAMVLQMDDPKNIYVVCIDYGNVEVVKMEDLYECSEYLKGLPCYPIPVKLRGVQKAFLGPNIREMMYDLGEIMEYNLMYSEKEYDHDKKIQVAVLTEVYKNGSLNRLMKTIITPTVPPLSEVGFKENYLPYVLLPTGKNIELVVMDNSLLKYGIIYCTIRELAYEITKMQRDLQAYGESRSEITFYAPPKNDLCIAKYDGKWCRGLSMELVGDGYPSILFVDYGNIVPTHISDIRPYPPQFRFPMMTTEVVLMGAPDILTDEQVKRFQQHLIVGSTVTCSELIRCEEDNNYSVRFDELQKIFELK